MTKVKMSYQPAGWQNPVTLVFNSANAAMTAKKSLADLTPPTAANAEEFNKFKREWLAIMAHTCAKVVS